VRQEQIKLSVLAVDTATNTGVSTRYDGNLAVWAYHLSRLQFWLIIYINVLAVLNTLCIKYVIIQQVYIIKSKQKNINYYVIATNNNKNAFLNSE
jgi:hypothetical protein